MNEHDDILIGVMAGKKQRTAQFIEQLLSHGFESFQINFWEHLGEVDLAALAGQVRAVLDAAAERTGRRATVSSLALFGNPLTDQQTRDDLARCIDHARDFGCDLVCGFTGALEDRPIDRQIDAFAETWRPLVGRARDAGVRIAFENCDMDGTWQRPQYNLAHAPRAWTMLFEALGGQEHVGLEWEPCHQLYSLVDPLPQLRQWVGRIFHVHGKDATVAWDIVRREGIRSGVPFAWHRTPGFGDTDWTDVISILRQGGFRGSIDIEGYHDPVYQDALEMTGQVHALNYLKQCRGGPFVPNPPAMFDK